MQPNALRNPKSWILALNPNQGEAIKMLKGGIEMSDRVVTVSPSYAQVLKTYALKVWGLRASGVSGFRGAWVRV